MILYGKPFVKKIESEILKMMQGMKTPPVLGIVLVGNDPASLNYIKRKELAAKKLGCESKLFHFPPRADETEIIALIKKINADKNIRHHRSTAFASEIQHRKNHFYHQKR